MAQAFKIKNLTNCCDEPRLIVNESFSYEVQLIDGKLFVDTNDYCSDGFEGLECTNCGWTGDIQEMINRGQVDY